MKQISIESWDELLKQLEPHDRIKPFYRGVRNADYGLIPKIGRPGVLKGECTKHVENQVLIRFKVNAFSHVDDLDAQGHDTEWFQVGQHYGLPTRLLDWSMNPLVAAYFAVEGDSEDSDAAIYMFTEIPIIKTVIPDILEIDKVEFLMPFNRTSRIAAQSGAFTVHNEPTIPYDDEAIIKLIIPSGLRDEIRMRLSHFGINHSTLFPDLGGIAAHISWHVSSEEYFVSDD